MGLGWGWDEVVGWEGEGGRVGTGYLTSGEMRNPKPEMKWNVRISVHGPTRLRPSAKVTTPREADMNAVGKKQTSASICCTPS